MSNPRVVSFHYILKDKSGTTIDSSEGSSPMTYLEGSGQIIPGLEKEMRSLNTGDKKTIAVNADEAYGEYDQQLAFDVPRAQFPAGEEIQVGMKFRAGDGGHDSPVFTVTKVEAQTVFVDGNHPLAGQDLFFDVEVTQVRAATKEEMDHGHAHGEGGHGHHH